MPIFSRSSPGGADDTGSASLRSRLGKSRGLLTRGFASLFGAGAQLDPGLLDDLEDVLISADIGVGPSAKIVNRLRGAVDNRQITSPEALLSEVRAQMVEILEPCMAPLIIAGNTYVLLVVGVNGVGKTTTVAKMAKRFLNEGKSVMLAAADTFRAAAVEQLKLWGDRLGVAVVSQGPGADAAAVAHDALLSAKAKSTDVLLIDTAGRQHTQSELMEQLAKIQRVLANLDPDAPHEVLQVLDAGTGQNALAQLEFFNRSVALDSLCLTKLDGTAKGGVLLAIADRFSLPVRFVGTGESYEDLRPFDAADFVDALLPDPQVFGQSN